MNVAFKTIQFFFPFFCQIWCSKFWVDGKLQASVPSQFYIGLRTNSLKFPTSFSFDNLTFALICYGAVVQRIRKLHGHELFWFGKKCQSLSDKLLAALYTVTVGFILCTLCWWDRCAFCSLISHPSSQLGCSTTESNVKFNYCHSNCSRRLLPSCRQC
jgi:hypothetical protein